MNITKLIAVAGPVLAAAEALDACMLKMGRATTGAVSGAARALHDEDLAAAHAVEDGAAVVNDLTARAAPRRLRRRPPAWTTAMILVSRAFERIADNAADRRPPRFAVPGSFGSRPVAPAA